MFHQHTERTTRKDQQNAKIVHYKKKIGPAGQKKDNLLLIPFITTVIQFLREVRAKGCKILFSCRVFHWQNFFCKNWKNFLNKKHNKFHWSGDIRVLSLLLTAILAAGGAALWIVLFYLSRTGGYYTVIPWLFHSDPRCILGGSIFGRELIKPFVF